MAGGPLSVGDLTADRPVSRRIYAIEPAGPEALPAWLDQFWGDVSVSYKEALEHRDEPD